MTTADNNQEGVLKKSINSGKWLAIGYAIQRSTGFISFLILARILSPKDFGVMAIILIVPNFLQATTELGFYPAIIQSEKPYKKYLNAIWTIGILKSLVIVLLTFLLAPIIAEFLNAEHITNAIRLGGLFSFILRLANPDEVSVYRDLKFKNVFFRDTARELVYIFVAVGAAIIFKSYWALVIATFVAKLTQMIVTYAQYSYKPKLSFQWKQLRELFGYSKWVVGQGWLNQIYGLIESVTVAKFTSIMNFGFYTKAKNLGAVGPGFISSVMNSVSFSAYSRLKNDMTKINEGIRKSFDILFFFIMPVSTVLVFAGGKLILLFLGPEWLPMTKTMQVIFFYFVVNLILDIIYQLFNGIGHPQKKVKMDLIKIILTGVLLVLLTIKLGIVGAAYGLLIGVIPVLFIALIHLKRLTKISYKKILATVTIPGTLSLTTLLPLWFYKDFIIQQNNLFLVAIGLLAALFYLAGTYFLGKKYKLGSYETLLLVGKHILKKA